MKGTVCAIIKQAQRDVYNQDLETFLFSHPAQISLLGIQFMWTADTQQALTNCKTDKSIMSKNMKKTDVILKELISLTVKTTLTKNNRTNLETCASSAFLLLYCLITQESLLSRECAGARSCSPCLNIGAKSRTLIMRIQ